MHFQSTKKSKPAETGNRQPQGTGSIGLPMAYFEIDSITENYIYCVKIKADLEKMKDEMDNKISGMQSDLENIQLGFQKKAQAGMTPQEQQDAMAVLNKKQQDINTKKQEYISQIENTTKDFEIKLKKSIQEFIKNYNTPQRFSFIVADEPGIFYYRDSIYDITRDVLNGLNENYKKNTKN
jgi:outer membrane protein